MEDGTKPRRGSGWRQAVDRLRATRVQPEGTKGPTWTGVLRAALGGAGGQLQTAWLLERDTTLLNDLQANGDGTQQTAPGEGGAAEGLCSGGGPPDTSSLDRPQTQGASGSREGRLVAFSEVVAVGSTFGPSQYDRTYRPKYRSRRTILFIRRELEALNCELFGSRPPCGMPGLRPLQSRTLQLPDQDSDDGY